MRPLNERAIGHVSPPSNQYGGCSAASHQLFGNTGRKGAANYPGRLSAKVGTAGELSDGAPEDDGGRGWVGPQWGF